MAGNILGEPINENIGQQIDLRQKIYGSSYSPSSLSRDTNVLNYLNNRNAWIKMASGVAISGPYGDERLNSLQSLDSDYLRTEDLESLKGTGLARKSILFNTIQTSKRTESQKNAGYESRSGVRNDNFFSNSGDKMYGGLGGNSRGLQPVGGITDIDIKSLNRGSIKKATVNIKVYNQFQFSIIEMLYLRLGYIMMLEWGWDKYVDKIDENNKPIIEDTQSTIIENSWFSSQSYTQRTMLNKIEYYKNRYKGNYGGFFGKVSNFSWTLNKDGSYDIIIDLITLGSVIESLKANVSGKDISKNELEGIQKKLSGTLNIEANDEGTYDNAIIDNLGSNTISQWLGKTIIDFPQNNKNYLYAPNLVGPYKTKSQVQGSEQLYTNQLRSLIPIDSRYYVRFGTFLNKLQTLIIGQYVNGNAKGKILEIEMAEENNICNYITNLIPLDMSKCIFSVNIDETVVKGKKLQLDITQFNKKLEPFPAKVGNTNVVYGKLMNIYLNFSLISSAIEDNIDEEDNISIYSFLESICKGINDSTGGTTNIELSIKQDKKIYFIENNPIKGYDSIGKKVQEYPLEIYGYNSNGSSNFVKDFNFKTKITPKLMSMISIGATAEGSSTKDIDAVPYKSWNLGFDNRFESKYTNSETSTDEGDSKEEKINTQKIKDAFLYDLKNYDSTDNLDYDNVFTINNYDWNYLGQKYIDIIPPDGSGAWSDKGLKGPSEDINNEQLLAEVVRRVKERNEEIATLSAEIGRKILMAGSGKAGIPGYLNSLVYAFGGDTGTSEFGSGESDRKYEQFVYNNTVAKAQGKWWSGNNTPDFVKTLKSNFKTYIRELNLLEFEQNQVNSSLSGFIPVELGITVDGIDGINIYNKIQINQKFLPSSYPNALKFIIKGVDHKISNNTWETTLTTISTAPTNQIPPNTTFSSNQASTSTQTSNSSGTTTIPSSSSTTSTSSGNVLSSYPELPVIDPPPPSNLLPYQEAVQILNSITTPSIAKAVFAVLFAEASKKGQAFRSAGGFNYAGVQTDVRSNGRAIRWGASKYIIARYIRKDAVRLREFAVFESNKTFLEFMVNRISSKNFNGDNGDSWTTTYINRWWSPAKKAEFTKGTTTYNNKLSIYESSQKRYNQYT
tara:strand:- start:1144 stop:4518 length:3375 start_codon:yes stop_codon:yes gene_type:complete